MLETRLRLELHDPLFFCRCNLLGDLALKRSELRRRHLRGSRRCGAAIKLRLQVMNLFCLLLDPFLKQIETIAPVVGAATWW